MQLRFLKVETLLIKAFNFWKLPRAAELCDAVNSIEYNTQLRKEMIERQIIFHQENWFMNKPCDSHDPFEKSDFYQIIRLQICTKGIWMGQGGGLGGENDNVVTWEPEGRYCCTKSMAITPFWLSTDDV